MALQPVRPREIKLNLEFFSASRKFKSYDLVLLCSNRPVAARSKSQFEDIFET